MREVAKHLICYSIVSKSIMNMTRILVLELYCQPMGKLLPVVKVRATTADLKEGYHRARTK